MLVELFALPGAGKSTVGAALAKRAVVTTRADVSAAWANSSALQRLAYIGRALTDRAAVTAALRFAIGARLTTRESLYRLLRLMAKTDWLRSRSGMVLLDQGFLQDIWSIFLSSKSASADPALLCSLIGALYRGIDATIVVLDVNPETASSRVAARTHGDSRFDNLPDRQLRDSIAAASGLQRLIVESARRAGLRILVIDGSPPAAIVTDRLLASLPAAQTRTGAEPTAPEPRRISVVGATGSGKTTLARELAERLNLPYCELDRMRQAVAEGSSGQSFHSQVADLARGEQWIIDGHYRDVRHLIWSRAQVVVWLNYPMRLVAVRVLKRFLRKRRARDVRSARESGLPAAARPVAQKGASWRRRFGRLVKTVRERSAYGRLLRADHPGATIVELRSVAATRQWLREL
jgi:adenylate kinase family enzyme